MKKLWKSCLALLVLVGLLLPTSAAGTGTLTISSVSGEQGETVSVEVRLQSVDVCGGSFNLN